VKVVVLRFNVRLFESGAGQAMVEERGLLVGHDSLSTCQFALFAQESA
jgi:hypothetical protein